MGVCTARAHHASTSEAEVIFTRQTAPERGRKGVGGGGGGGLQGQVEESMSRESVCSAPLPRLFFRLSTAAEDLNMAQSVEI